MTPRLENKTVPLGLRPAVHDSPKEHYVAEGV